MRNRIILLLFTVFYLCCVVHAQLWSGIIDPSRAVDWRTAGIPERIPNRTNVCTTLDPGATASQITSAIAACPSGKVVFLNAGTYNLSSGIDFSGVNNVTLRGAGPDKTLLIFTGAINCLVEASSICLSGASRAWSGDPTLEGSPVHNWISGFAQGSTVLTFDSTSGWSVGQVLDLDQFNDTSDTGGVFIGDVTGKYIQETLGPGRLCPNAKDPSCGTQSGNRTQQEFKLITAINGNQVTISPPIYMPNWRMAQVPQGWSTGVVGARVGTMIGVESLSIDSTNDGSAAISNIQIANCYKCWVKNVRSINANRNHVWLEQSVRVEVRENYMFGTKNAQSQSYGVEAFMTSDDLIENNILQNVTTPLMGGNDYGTVAAYNFAIDSFFSNPVGYMAASLYSNHDVSAMNLFEGNDLNQIISDNIHGTSQLATFFRNRVRGWDTPTPSNATWAINMMAYNRLSNIVGNVLGTQGIQMSYEETASAGSTSCSNASNDIFLLGYKEGCVGGTTTIVNDPLTVTTALRWGNFDAASSTAKFNCSEVDPAGSVTFSTANACPGSQTLPTSFYLSAQPIWWKTPWGTPAFPPIGPDVTGGTAPDGLGGHAHSIPAQLCYQNTPTDASYGTSGVRLFRAGTCYGPPAPTITNVVVH